MIDSRLEVIFNAALLKVAPEERSAYLDGACGTDPDLRVRLESLLRAHDEAGRFLNATEATPGEEIPGAIIGRYKLLQQIGEGGFGMVYMAEQLEPVRRKVALKVIKLGMDTKQVVARFESERQALAMMDHPNIARVFDAGATNSGRPYFVMELVRGVSITEYCDQHRLATAERLQLCIAVCMAMHHAHQKGIIHRDLKPSNILVTLHDGKPIPKVIDFGIAKATHQRLTEKTLFTEYRQFIGTPLYMSPEQAEMSGLDVDTRSDIYSLGVILYELLTGSTPFPAERLKEGGYLEMQRILREEDPPSPSIRVSTLGVELDTVAHNRAAEPLTLPKVIRGDLDWIVMKALEKDRSRRYETSRDLAVDLERFLRNEPVSAGPPTARYRIGKFIRRHRLQVVSSVLFTAAILVGLSLAAMGLVQARREAARSQAIADFLQEILASIDPEETSRRSLEVQRVVDRARLLFGDDHATVAATLSSLALQVEHGGNWDAAEPLYRESLRIWRSTQGEHHLNVAITLSRFGTLLRHRGDNAGAEEALRESLRITGGRSGDALRVACDTRTELAEILKRGGKLDEAESLLREALAFLRHDPAGQQFAIASALEQLVNILIQSGKVEETESVFREILETMKPLFPADSLLIAGHNVSFAMWLRQHGKSNEAERYLRESLRIYRNSPHPPNEYYFAALDGLFQIVRRRDEAVDESISLFNETMATMSYLYGKDHLLIAPHLISFAKALEERDRSAEAIPLLVDGIRIYRKAKGPEWDARDSLNILQRTIRKLMVLPNVSADHLTVARQGIDALLTERPDDLSIRSLQGVLHFRRGEFEEAYEALSGVVHSGDQVENEVLAQCRIFLAMSLVRIGRREDAMMIVDQVRHQNFKDGTSAVVSLQRLLGEVESMLSNNSDKFFE